MLIRVPTSGIEIDIRRQPAQLLDIIRGRVEDEMKPQRPDMPKQRVEISPGEYRDVDAPNDEYEQQMTEFNTLVGQKFYARIWEVMADIGITSKPDIDELDTLRATYAKYGAIVPDNDKLFWLQYVVAPGIDDFNHLLYEIFGKSLPSDRQVAFYRQLFRS